MNSFIWLFILAHLIGDFVLQTNKVAKMKAASAKGLILHFCLIVAAQVLLMGIFYGLQGILAAIGVSLVHWLIDYTKIRYTGKFKYQSLYFIFDQALHMGTILIVSWLLNPGSSRVEINMLLLPLNVMVIVAVYVLSIFVQLLLNDFLRIENSKTLFEPYERTIDAATALLLLLLIAYGMLYMIPLVILIGVFFGLVQRRLYGYQLKAITAKLLVFLVFALGASLVI